MAVEYGDDCMSQTKVYKCVDKFKRGLMSVADNVHSGWPSAVICKGFGVTESAISSRIWDN
jgi:hypothetical protein